MRQIHWLNIKMNDVQNQSQRSENRNVDNKHDIWSIFWACNNIATQCNAASVLFTERDRERENNVGIVFMFGHCEQSF